MLSDEEKAVLKTAKENYGLTSAEQKILVNLIEKQSKEIEEYKKQLDLDYVDKHFVPIERYNQLEKEIEELKEESKEYQIGFAQGCYERDLDWNDKIEAKIEELEEYLYKGNIKDDFLMIRIKAKIQELQSLLEKE